MIPPIFWDRIRGALCQEAEEEVKFHENLVSDVGDGTAGTA
jgi:hypothetical protein